jgi:hypothetical protein
MPRLSAPSGRGAKEKLRQVNTQSVAVGVSAFAHSAAIGLLLALRPVPLPDPAPTVETIEVSIESEQALGSRRPNELSGNNPRERPVDVSAMPFPSLIRPDVTATGPPSDWPGSVNAGHFYDVPAQPIFKPRTRSLVLDMLGTMLDCLAVEGSSRGASRHPLRAHPPCVSADLPLRAPVTMSPSNASESSGSAFRTSDDYRTFKPVRPIFDESLFPEKIPQANRALEKWITGLFH